METKTLGNEIFEQLRADWGHLSRIDRGRLLRAVVDAGWKKRGLARELRCSEGLVRQLIDSAKMQEHSTGIGRKEAVKMAVQERQAQRQQALAVAADQRPRLRQEWLKRFVEWVHDSVAACDRPMFMSEIRNGPYSIRQAQFAKASPKPHEIRPGADPRKVIRNCRPEGKNFSEVCELIEDRIEWFARWGPRVMYDKSLREEVLAKAEQIFERERCPR